MNRAEIQTRDKNISALWIRRKKIWGKCIYHQFSSVTQSCLTLCDPMDCSMPGFIVHQTPRACSDSYPMSAWCHPAISSSVFPFSSCFHSFPASETFLMLWGVSTSHQVAKVLELQLQRQSLQWIFRTAFLYDWLVWSPCSRMDSQEFSPSPQFKNINSLVLSFLYHPTLTSIHDYL